MKLKEAWLTSSGWIMWNAQWIALSQGATVVLFDFAPNKPDMLEVWRHVWFKSKYYNN